MRVEQQQMQGQNIAELMQQACGMEDTGRASFFGAAVKAEEVKSAHSMSFQVKEPTYLNPAREEQKTLVEEMEEGSALDARGRKNQMAVLAGTTSEEDYAKMQEEGFSLDSTTSNTIVTVTDKIKAELAKAGVDISCFGDDLDMEQLAEITGSPELARQLVQAIREEDLPLSGENIRQVAETVALAGSLSAPDDDTIKYLLDNGLAPTAQNLYVAEHSGIGGTKTAEQLNVSSFLPQIKTVILEAGLPVNDETIETSRWMLEQDIPLTKEKLSYACDLRSQGLSTQPEQVAKLAAQAIREGGTARDAVLLPGYTLTEQAERAVAVVTEATDEELAYLVGEGRELTLENLAAAKYLREAAVAEGAADAPEVQAGAGAQNAGTSEVQTGAGVQNAVTSEAQAGTAVQNTDVAENTVYTDEGLALISARRQLEELRLVMTASANYALLKQGISIDTEPLAQLVEQLKDLENSYYRNLLQSQGVDAGEENAALFREVTEKVTEIRFVPAYVLGMKDTDVLTISGVHESGSALKAALDRANERYETLMTAPRADLGDSIQKAFANVDDILEDLSLETSEQNRRAVRILAYNELSITPESVGQMKAADEEVQRMFRNMTPAVVTQMIKRGVNPLEMDFAGINRIAEEIQSELGDSTDRSRFGEYLWKLEQNGEISEDERSAYIGIYRLIRQVENTDGAAIGALIHQGADLTMKNLLTAVRSGKRSGGMDYAVDDDFGGVERTAKENVSVTEQIEAGYQNNCLKDILNVITPERLKAVLSGEMNWENMTPEQLKAALTQAQTDESSVDQAYAKQQLADLTQAAEASRDIYQILQRYDIPNTVTNVLAMQAMMADRNQMYRKIFGVGIDADEVTIEDLEEIRQELLKEFGEAASKPAAMAEAQEKLGELAENVMKTMINSERVTSLDVREMKLLAAQLSVSSILAKEEHYSVPVMVNDEMMNVSVKIVRGVDKKGIVDIMMESQLRGKIAATFQAKENGIHGFVASDSRETVDLLRQEAARLTETLSAADDEVRDLHCAYIEDLTLNYFSEPFTGEEAETQGEDNSGEAYRIQTVRLYRIAESFLKMIKETL